MALPRRLLQFRGGMQHRVNLRQHLLALRSQLGTPPAAVEQRYAQRRFQFGNPLG